jgi:hypothetical protein
VWTVFEPQPYNTCQNAKLSSSFCLGMGCWAVIWGMLISGNPIEHCVRNPSCGLSGHRKSCKRDQPDDDSKCLWFELLVVGCLFAQLGRWFPVRMCKSVVYCDVRWTAVNWRKKTFRRIDASITTRGVEQKQCTHTSFSLCSIMFTNIALNLSATWLTWLAGSRWQKPCDLCPHYIQAVLLLAVGHLDTCSYSWLVIEITDEKI